MASTSRINFTSELLHVIVETFVFLTVQNQNHVALAPGHPQKRLRTLTPKLTNGPDSPPVTRPAASSSNVDYPGVVHGQARARPVGRDAAPSNSDYTQGRLMVLKGPRLSQMFGPLIYFYH
jgi:hypothetical protein